MEEARGFRGDRGQVVRAEGYVKEFTRHSNDVLLNLNELRHRGILTDTKLVVGAVQLRAHCVVLVACSGFFYTMYSRRMSLQGAGGGGDQMMTVSLPNTLDPSCVSLLLDFMYTSRLPLTPGVVSGVLAVAAYLQMDHVADTCREFMQLHCTENISEGPHQDFKSPLMSPNGEEISNTGLESSIPAVWKMRLPIVQTSHKPGAFLTYQPNSKELKDELLPDARTASPSSPANSSCHPSSPAESNTCSKNLEGDSKPTLDPKACNWKKYKYIVLNPLFAATKVKEESEELHCQALPGANGLNWTPSAEASSGEVPGQIDRQGQASCYEGSGRAPPLKLPLPKALSVSPSDEERTASPISTGSIFPQSLPTDCKNNPFGIKHAEHSVTYYRPGNFHGGRSISSGEKPYHCNVCGAQFNRPANLKTHARIHSGEKPYRCDTCGARFVQVAHLRAHVLIHTGEKPYPCHTCGTRFRHLQTLKSHLRIHTGEKPYACERCDLHFRHKSQLRLHLRQKHGAVTNTKIRYKVLTETYQPLLQAC